MVPLLLIGTALAIVGADGPTSEAAVGLPLVIFTVAGYLIGVVWLRPRIGSAYLPVAIAVPVVLIGLAYAFDPWWARVALGTAIIVLALGVSVVLGHLAFLGAQLLLITPGALQRPSFTDQELETIFAARRPNPPAGAGRAEERAALVSAHLAGAGRARRTAAAEGRRDLLQ